MTTIPTPTHTTPATGTQPALTFPTHYYLPAGTGYWTTDRYPRGGDFRRAGSDLPATIIREDIPDYPHEVEVSLPGCPRACVVRAHLRLTGSVETVTAGATVASAARAAYQILNAAEAALRATSSAYARANLLDIIAICEGRSTNWPEAAEHFIGAYTEHRSAGDVQAARANHTDL